MTWTTPALVVVCGAPASGKTTLARRLASDLHLPLLEKDIVKESLAGTFPTPDRDASRVIGRASTRLLWELALAMLERGVSVMIECNFYREFAVDDLQLMSAASRILVVQCEADASVIEQRYRERAAQGKRHAAHFDLDALQDLLAGLDDGRYDLTGLGHDVLQVRTDGGCQIDYVSIADTVRRRLVPC